MTTASMASRAKVGLLSPFSMTIEMVKISMLMTDSVSSKVP